MARVVSFSRDGTPGFGVLHPGNDVVVDFAAIDLAAYGVTAPAVDALALVQMGKRGIDLANAVAAHATAWPEEARINLADVKLLPPLPRPLTVRDFVSFEKHLRQCARRHFGHDEWRPPAIWYERPVYYRGNPFSFVGHDANVPIPEATEAFDYELELGFVIGKGGRDIPASHAMEHVFGLTIFNDFTARDVQRADAGVFMGPARSKDYDDCNAMGPSLVTLDELDDPADLEMKIRLNGQEIGVGNSGAAQHSIADMVAFASMETTLHAGEFMATGTVGNGAGLEKGISLVPGDVVELEISGLGVLRNRIVTSV